MLEAADVLNVLGIPGQDSDGGAGGIAGGRERPADVLLCRAQDVRVGAAGGQQLDWLHWMWGLFALILEATCRWGKGWVRLRNMLGPHALGLRQKPDIGLQGWFYSL